MSNPLMDAALAYAGRGWHVLPLHGMVGGRCTCGRKCGSPGKHPRTVNGLKDATTDRDQIRHWWERFPDANIGVRTGSVSGLWVVDVDNKRSVDLGDGTLVGLGSHSLETLEAEIDESVPETLESQTGSGGSHLLFRYPDGGTHRNRANLAPGVDIRGEDGYIVVPPSVHASGHPYQWVDPDAVLAAAPRWLVEFQPKGDNHQFGELDAVGEGGRNDYLFRYGSKLRGEGRDEREIQALIHGTNMTVCDPPLPRDEVETIIRQVMQYQPNERAPEVVFDEAEEDLPELEEGDLVFKSIGWLLQNPPEPKRPIVDEGLLDEGDGALIVGQSGIGKSWMGMDLALSVAMGMPWLNEFDVEQGPVVYIDEEGAPWDLFKRFRQISTSRGVAFSDPMLAQNLVYSVAEEIKLDSDKGLTQVRRIIGDLDPKLIIFDALVRMHDGDENSNKDMARFFQIVKRIKKNRRTAFLFLHHIRKPTKDDPDDELNLIRGAGDIRAWPDTILSGVQQDNGTVRVTHGKSRGHQKIDPFYVEIDANEHEVRADLRVVGRGRPPKTTEETRTRILEAINQIVNSPAYPEVIAGQLQLTTETITRHLKVMVEQGVITTYPVGGRVAYTFRSRGNVQPRPDWLQKEYNDER